MPRDSQGVYSLPAGNPVISGAVISSTWANTTMPDIATALTDSLDRNGRGGMLAPFRFQDGTVSAPGASWSNEPTTGWCRAGNGDLRCSILSADLFRLQGGQAQIWANAQWNNLLYSAGSGSIPNGTAPWQSITWNNSTQSWVPTSDFTINDATGNAASAGDISAVTFTEGGTGLSAKYLGIAATAANSLLLGGQNGAYYLNLSNHTGTLPAARLSGTYTITVNGNASNATLASNSSQLNGQAPSYYLAYANFTGTVPSGALSGSYTITASNATLAAQANTVTDQSGGTAKKIQTGALPGTRDPNTIYFVTA